MGEGAVVGTSSLRRRAQLLHRRPDLKVVEFRGNVQTRLGKLADGVAEGTFLAMAGLTRLGLVGTVNAAPISEDDMLPAVAQGAIGIERRSDDDAVAAMLDAIRHPETEARLAAERAFLAALDGSCQTPIAGLAEISGARMIFRGEILSPDGSTAYAGRREGAVSDGAAMGRDLAASFWGRRGLGSSPPDAALRQIHAAQKDFDFTGFPRKLRCSRTWENCDGRGTTPHQAIRQPAAL